MPIRRSIATASSIVAALFVALFATRALAADYEPTPACPDFRQVSLDEVQKALDNLQPAPRLLLTDDAIERARHNVEVDPRWRGYYEALKTNADDEMKVKPVERVLTGVRLLSVSRRALKRTLDWSFLYRFTGDEKYAQRVEREALAIADFEDWHPQHFLDVAEMTVAEAIAYDSCKEVFSEESRAKIREAIMVKGVLEARDIKGWWKRNTANWNQVCWCGQLFGALAIASDVDESQRSIIVDAITDSVNGVTWAMSSYEPDGNYTEGPGYWAYGTSFNLILLDALQTSLGTDFGRSDAQGLLKSIEYFENVFGTSGEAFNYPDSGGGRMFESTAFWYERKLNDPNILWNENNSLLGALKLSRGEEAPGANKFSWHCGDRLGSCALLWGSARESEESFSASEPNSLGYVGLGNGRCCVALFRTGWSNNDAYLGIKCGAPNSPHGHMDEGGFVYEDRGVRWVVELGPESYNKIESLGMHLWDMKQGSDRWKLLRYNNFGHSVPTIDGQEQLVDGVSTFTETKIGGKGEESTATIDLTPIYANVLAKATRRATLKPDGTLLIEDEFEAKPDKEASVERRFIVGADVELQDGAALLKQRKGSEVKRFATTSDVETALSVVPCETENDYDSKNPNASILIETSRIAPGGKAVYATEFATPK